MVSCALALGAAPAMAEEAVIPPEAIQTHDLVEDADWQLTEEATDPFSTVGVTWDAATTAEPQVELRVRTDEGWSEWQDVPTEAATGADEGAGGGNAETRPGTDPVWVGEARGVDVRLRAPQGTMVDPEVALINPDAMAPGADAVPTPEPQAPATAEQQGPATRSAPAPQAAGSVPRPAIVSRSQWGAGGWECSDPLGDYANAPIKGFVVHHTAGSNSYTRAQSAGIVRGIWAYHTQSQGWCDIGYNFLVDKYGTIYEGRAGSMNQAIRGAHAGSWNRNTIGVSMMGTYESTTPSAATTNAVSDVIAWWASAYDVNPRGRVTLAGKTVNTIMGHRDVMATSCPGARGYAQLGSIRSKVAARLSNPIRDPEPATTTVKRLRGSDRYNTSVAISRELAPNGAHTVYVATGTDYPDALAAGPATGGTAPLLLTRRDSLPGGVAHELKRLQPRQVYIVGGPNAVAPEVFQQIRRDTGARVVRLRGSDRYGTAVALAEPARTQYLVSGTGFADALTAASPAARTNSSILLTEPGRLPTATRDFLRSTKPSRVVIVGGTGAVSDTVKRQVESLGITVERVGGATRYDTSLAMATRTWSAPGTVAIANGSTFPDALAGGPLAIRRNGPVLLSGQDRLFAGSKEYAQRSSVRTAYLLGGPNALANSVGTGL